jgi:hypothetical protein
LTLAVLLLVVLVVLVVLVMLPVHVWCFNKVSGK